VEDSIMPEKKYEDHVYHSFLEVQRQEGTALAAESDLLDLVPLPNPGRCIPVKYIARFHCKGLVQDPVTRRIEDHHGFDVGIWFPPNYLRHVDPLRIATLLEPRKAWHPNIYWPFICLGRLTPGTTLVDLVYQAFEVITYKKFTSREDDALNATACAWARRHMDRFPVDTRPLKGSAASFHMDHMEPLAPIRVREEGAS